MGKRLLQRFADILDHAVSWGHGCFKTTFPSNVSFQRASPSGQPRRNPLLLPSDIDCYYWSHLNWWRFDTSNCAEGQRREYEGNRYCTLHYPGQDKDDFQGVIEQKLKSKDFDFRGAEFPSTFTPRERYSFDKEANFLDAHFKKGLSLRGVTFAKGVNFSEACFEGEPKFTGAKFVERANFSKASFQRETTFSNAIFGEVADFSWTTFCRSADFSEASFHKEAKFMGTTFEQGANFSRAIFLNRATFYGNDKTKVFNGQSRIDFQYAQVYEPENFSVHSAVLRPNWFINVAGLRRFNFVNIENWDRSLKEEMNELVPLDTVPQRRRVPLNDRYRLLGEVFKELAINAEENRLYADANKFHYWSMQALRKSNWSRYLNPITFLHWALSGYGNRPFRAFCALLTIYLGFAIGFWLWTGSAQDNGCKFAPLDHWQALKYSLGAITLQLQDSLECVTGKAAFLVFLEGALGPIQVALLALAIRRKFMR